MCVLSNSNMQPSLFILMRHLETKHHISCIEDNTICLVYMYILSSGSMKPSSADLEHEIRSDTICFHNHS